MTPTQNPSSDGKFHPQNEFMDDALQRELDEALGEASLEDILAAEEAPPATSAGRGRLRKGRVVDIQGDDVFVDMGGKSQGILAASQFGEDDPLPKIGDIIEVTIEGADPRDGVLLLSRQGAIQEASWETLAEGQVVEGRVTGHNKGGLELLINGIRAFMPISQIELFRIEDLSVYKDQKIRCRVSEVDRENNNLIVSRRAMLQEEADAKRQATFEALEEGQVVKGVVRSVMPYGAFVDIGGIDGLLHVRDMSYSRVEDPRTIVQEGLELQVKILHIDREEKKIGLGLKQVLPDPWLDAENRWPAGSMASGRITKLADFGAFIELAPGVEGLIPISEMSLRRVNTPADVVAVGDVVKVRVLKIDTAQKRISLSIKQAGDDPWIGATVRWPVGSTVQGIVTRLADFGAFVELTAGVEGMVHISQLSHDRVRSVADALDEGDTVQAKVLSVDEETRRISLSIKELKELTVVSEALQKHDPAKAAKRKKPLKGGLD